MVVVTEAERNREAIRRVWPEILRLFGGLRNSLERGAVIMGLIEQMGDRREIALEDAEKLIDRTAETIAKRPS